MSKSYKQLSKYDRDEIEYFLNKWYSFRKIWRIIKRPWSTISREVKLNIQKLWVDKWKYIWGKAHHKYYVRKKYAKKDSLKIIKNMKLKEYIDNQLVVNHLSPEQISWLLLNKKIFTYVSKGSIYKYIRSVYGRKIEAELNLELVKRKKKSKKLLKVTSLENRIFIDQRPNYINEREYYWDWEWDFIVSWRGGKHALLVLYERKSKFILIRRVKTRSIEEVHEVLHNMIAHLLNFNSLTLDNDISFRRHEELAKLLNTNIYFCFPYRSWEKWWVEYANRLIRRFIPKWDDISLYTDDELNYIEVIINNMPRKWLQFKTPLEIMLENNQLKPWFIDYPNTDKYDYPCRKDYHLRFR